MLMSLNRDGVCSVCISIVVAFPTLYSIFYVSVAFFPRYGNKIHASNMPVA
jgi:hypothetical protein